MNKIIEEYYNELGFNPVLIAKNIEIFERNPDIAKEFEYWIKQKKYIKDGCVEVEGYTAESISQMSKVMVGDSSFLLLIELRENPIKAKNRIDRGFKIK